VHHQSARPYRVRLDVRQKYTIVTIFTAFIMLHEASRQDNPLDCYQDENSIVCLRSCCNYAVRWVSWICTKMSIKGVRCANIIRQVSTIDGLGMLCRFQFDFMRGKSCSHYGHIRHVLVHHMVVLVPAKLGRISKRRSMLLSEICPLGSTAYA
jgi:hypothetical protein